MIQKRDRAGFTENAALEAIHAYMVDNARAMAALQDEAHYLAKLAQLRFHQIERGEWPEQEPDAGVVDGHNPTLDALQLIVARWDAYRIQHDMYGDGSRASGWAWDQVTRATEAAKSILAAMGEGE